MIVIMLGGKARVGKTTAANILKVMAEEAGLKPIILPFAKAIKDEAQAMGISKETSPDIYRAFCQEIGKTKRAENPDHWVEEWLTRYNILAKEENKSLDNETKKYKERVIIVDDCRYMNEVALGRKIGAVQIFIGHGTRTLEDHNGAWRLHESEDMNNKIELKDKDYCQLFDYRIDNSDSVAEFLLKVGKVAVLCLNVLAESLVMCGCETCKAFRQNREIDGSEVAKEVQDFLDNLYRKEIPDEPL